MNTATKINSVYINASHSSTVHGSVRTQLR